MFTDSILVIIFFGTLFALWYRISLKLPQLIAVPDEVITARFQEDSARLRLRLINLKILYNERRVEKSLWRLWGKILYRLHIILLRFDNTITASLKRLRERSGYINGNGGEEYFKPE